MEHWKELSNAQVHVGTWALQVLYEQYGWEVGAHVPYRVCRACCVAAQCTDENTNSTSLTMVPSSSHSHPEWRSWGLWCHSELPKLPSRGQLQKDSYSRFASSWRPHQNLSRSHCRLCKHKSGLGVSFFFLRWGGGWRVGQELADLRLVPLQSAACGKDCPLPHSMQEQVGMKRNNQFAEQNEHFRQHTDCGTHCHKPQLMPKVSRGSKGVWTNTWKKGPARALHLIKR